VIAAALPLIFAMGLVTLALEAMLRAPDAD